MLDPLPDTAPLGGALTKWDAVRTSLESFVQAPETADIGIGLQYFPQSNTGVSFACFASSECGGGGACTSTLCVTKGQSGGAAGAPPLEFLRVAGDRGTAFVSNAPLTSCVSARCGTAQDCDAYPAPRAAPSPRWPSTARSLAPRS